MLRDSVLGATYNKTVLDAFNAAFRFPNMFRRVFGEGALSACFIPLYVEYKKNEDHESLSKLTIGVLTLILIILIPLNAFVILNMDHLIGLLIGDGFDNIPGKLEMTVKMTKIMFPFLLLISMFAFCMAVLNAHKKFVMSAVAPSLYNLTLILVNVYCYWAGLFSEIILAWTVIAAAFLQFIVLVPPYLKLNLGYKFKWSHVTSEPVKRVLWTFAPAAFGISIVQMMTLINLKFAAQAGEGSVTYVSYSDRLLELPLSLIAVSLGTVLLPLMSEQRSGRVSVELNKSLNRAMKLVMFLAVPAAAGLWMISPLIVSILYERGHLGPKDIAAMVSIVQIYSFTVLAASQSRILAQAFYAHKNTLLPGLASAVGLVVHYFLGPYLMRDYGLNGLIASTSFAAYLNLMVLLIFYRQRHGSLFLGNLLWFFVKCCAAAATIIAICAAVKWALPTNNFAQRSLALALAMTGSMVGYFGVAALLRLEEAQFVLGKFSKKLKR